MENQKLLEVQNLHVSFDTYVGEIQAVRGISFFLNEAESIGIVGESGCGKTVSVQSVMKLIPMPPGRIKKGKILFKGKDITNYSNKKMRPLRGSEMSMIFQDPMTSLNPTMRIGNQVIDVLLRHKKITINHAWEKTAEMLRMVGLPNPKNQIKKYPHELSGGMRQRIMIAIALICEPKLLIADEPTTALDVTIQAQILDLMKELKNKINTSIILITHDLGVIAGMAERVIVMYAGKIMESGPVNEIFSNPKHPYTWGLLESIPRLDAKKKERKFNTIPGYPPDLFSPPAGCPFADRCHFSMEICYEKNPAMESFENEHYVACWLTHPFAPKISWEKTTRGRGVENDRK